MSCVSPHVEDIHNALSVMQKTLECPICLDLMKEPVTTRCDHTFCRFCMSQLLSRKKKGRAQCPMCKKDVTKRSLQESPRFKLLIDGLKKIINAFELDSGYKFSPSQDHVKNILMTCEESKRKEEQTVVQSTGYRNRNRKRIVNGERREDHPTLLETNIDTLLTRDAETESFSRLQCKKQETNVKCKRTLNTEFESSHSNDDLFKNANSLGNECDRSCLLSELGEDDESAKSQDEELNICENVSLKPETDEVIASDLAEYGFSERDLESTRSNLLCMEGARALKETTAKKRSSEAQDSLILDVDIAARKAEQCLLCELAEDTMHSEHNGRAGSTTQSKKYIHDESQTLKIAIDNQYYKGDSAPEDVASNPSSPISMSNAVPRKRLKISIQRVNEWLQKTSEFLNAMPWDEELLSEVFPELDEDLSDKGSCVSSETEIMIKPCPSSVSGAVEKTVNVRDKIFGKVYKREKKSSPVPKITVLANVHVNSAADSQKINDIPQSLTNSLEPENFIQKVETTDNSYTNEGDTLLANNNLLNTDKRVTILDSKYLNNGNSNAQETKLKTQNKSLKRKSENALSTRTLQSLLLVKGSDLSMDKPSPSRFSEIEINTYPSSNESGHKDDQRNVRRSRRINVLSKKALPSPNQKPAETSGKVNTNIDPACFNANTDTNFQAKQMCTTFNKSEDKITTMLAPKVKVVPLLTDVEIHPAPPECQTSQLTDVGVQEYWNMPVEAVKNVSSAENIDSDTDTQHLIKAFKSAKRMSFKLDPVNEIDNKEHFITINLSDTKTNLPNCSQAGIALTVSEDKEVTHTDDAILSNGRNLSKFTVSGEAMKQSCNNLNLPTRQGETLERLNMRFENKLVFSSEKSGESSMEGKDMPMLYETEMISADQLDALNPVNDIEPHKEDNQERNSVVSTSEQLVLCSQSPSVRQGETRGVTAERENEQVKKAYWKASFHEEQINQITSENRSQGSVTEQLLEHSVTCQSSSLKSPEVYSDTPDGLLGIAERPGEEHSFCAEAEKSFVFGKEQKVGVSDSSKSLNDSPLITRKKRKAPMLESSEKESSDDEELPCFSKLLFGIASNSAGQKNALSGFSPKQQGGGVLDMFSSNSTSGKSQASLNFPVETLLGSQESVNLFSSQSNTSDHPTDVIIDQELKHDRSECHEKNSKRKGDTISSNKQVQKEDYETANNYEDTCKEQNLDEVSECESEGSHFSTLSSQCEVFNTQQRDALRNNLEKLQEEMAALEAVLEQHNTPSPLCKKEQASTAELKTIRLQEASQKQTDHGMNISPDAIPETKMPSLRSVEQPVQELDIGSESPTPPLSPHQTRSGKQTPERVCSTVSIFKSLKESALTQEEPKSMELSAECHPSTKEPDTHKPPAASLSEPTTSPRRSLRSTTRNIGTMNTISTDGRRVSLEAKRQSQKRKENISDKRSSSPIFTSPKRSRRGSTSNKIPVVTNRRNFSLVASGLNQSEMMLAQKFARKTQSVFCSEISESTTHIVIKTDEYLVCHRTMKYFLGIAGRKWVVSYNWIVQSFREGRILDEYDFEVKGDVISGRNHRGPRRSRLGSDGLLLSDFEICCLGSFRDMTRENLEWMVSLCGASFVMEPQMLKHKEGNTSLVVVQGDEQTDYAVMRKRYRALVVTREWVLDSVSSYKLQPFDSYLV